jgi:hypothetical protein
VYNKLRKIYHLFKNGILDFKEFYRWRIKNWVKHRLNNLIRSQIIKPSSIPIIIVSFNQLHYLKKQINNFLNSKFTNIVIIDNNSTYPPLLSYFDELEGNKNITIHRLKENYGHLVFWKQKELFQKYSKGYYVVTDADIIPMEKVPNNFINEFRKLLDKYEEVTKVGFSLFLDDIPDTNPNKEKIISWEKQFWKNKRDELYFASIDTTFALYRPNYKREESNFLKGIRMNFPYYARHGGWYVNPLELTDEQKYYIETANNSSSWLMDENGELKNTIFKEHYND